ncbi:MAG: AMP-dependent synthetase/ligase [Propionicimonas sp.]
MIDVEKIMQSAQPTVGALFRWRVGQTPAKEAFRYPDANDAWTSIDWTETRRRVDELAAGLLALGLKSEERVAIVSNTRIEWILIDYAINCAGGATTTVYPNTMGEDFAHIVTDSESVILVAENADQLAKLEDSSKAAQQLRHVVLLDGEGDGERVLSWKQLVERGRAFLAEDPGVVDRSLEASSTDGLSTLIYTSGTTGMPKGVELTHRVWTYQARVLDAMGVIPPGAVQYLWLPLSHVFGKALLTIQLGIGFSTAVDGRIDRIVSGLGAVHPTFMCGAPRIFEKVRAAVLLASPHGGLKGRIARWAFAVGRASREYRLDDRPLPVSMRVAYTVADRLVFSKLKERVGGNIDFFVSGSAKLNSQVQSWFYSAGLMIVEGYGLTETGAVTCVNLPLPVRLGTVGPAMPGTELRIAEDGEVLTRGPGVMRGYHNDPELTAEVMVDGWFHTGDIGKLDSDGFLTITDRKKDLLKTSGGKYVAPSKVEGVVAASIPYVSQVVVVGDGRKYISALLTMDKDNLLKWATRHGMADLDYAVVTQHPDLRKTIQRFLDSANGKLERWETVKRFAILPAELSVDDGGVTPNMKIRRKVVAEKYADVVESLYDAEPVDVG